MKVGDRFHRLTVLRVKTDRYNEKRNTYPYCLVQCECGNVKEINRNNVKRGAVKSCGCLFREAVRKSNRKHGLSNSPEYAIWLSMKARCKHKSQRSYVNYGGRGIKVCERWFSFSNFYSDVGPRPSPDHQIERRNNDGDYEPGNCIWVSRKVQCRNKRSNKVVKFRGVEKPLIEWCEIQGLNYDMVEQRLRVLDWSPERALTEPSNYRG